MSPRSAPDPVLPAAAREARAQSAIRALTGRGRLLTVEERQELARLQREWLRAYREGLVTAA